MAAREILGEGEYTKRDITYYSLGGLTERLLKRVVPPKGMDTVETPSPDPVDGTARPA